MRPNIVQVGVDFVPANGGMATSIRDFHRALGGRVISFTRPHLIARSADPGVVHVPTHGNPLGAVYAWSSAPDLQQAAGVVRDADLIIVHGLFRYHAQWVFSLARAARTPFWVVPHGGLDPYVFTYRAWQKRPWMALVGRPMMRAAASVIFATAREREKAAGHLRGTATAIVPWPVETGRDAGVNETRQAIRDRFGIPRDARVLILLGRLHPAKRILETIRTVGELGDPRLFLFVVGPGSEELTEEACRTTAAQAGCERAVICTGPVYGEAKYALLGAADALVNLSHKENFGYAAAEALSVRLPVILSPGNDLASDLRAAQCGWFLDSLTDAEVKNVLREFVDASPEDLVARADRGRRWVERELGTERFRQRLFALAAATAPQGGNSAGVLEAAHPRT
jgi:glycosyltransferase involved in cell wall biosynthesis